MNSDFKFTYKVPMPKGIPALILFKCHSHCKIRSLCEEVAKQKPNRLHIYCEVGLETATVAYALKTAREVVGINKIMVAYEAVESR